MKQGKEREEAYSQKTVVLPLDAPSQHIVLWQRLGYVVIFKEPRHVKRWTA